jgi:hypothetical protein
MNSIFKNVKLFLRKGLFFLIEGEVEKILEYQNKKYKIGTLRVDNV